MDSAKNKEKDDEILQAARDWAHSIQARLAEKLSGETAKETSSDDILIGPHRTKVKASLVKHGLTEADAESLLNTHASKKVSELDYPRVRDIIENNAGIVFKVMKALEMPDVSKRILLSSLATGEVNALVARNTWDPFIHIFVDADLVVFCSSISKIISNCLVNEKGDLLSQDDMLQKAISPEIQAAIKDLYQSSTFWGYASASEPFLFTSTPLQVHAALSQGMLVFVVGHEIAHLILGHIDNDEASCQVAARDISDTNIFAFSHLAELQADATGAFISACATKTLNNPPLLAFASSYIFMRALFTLQNCKAIFNGSNDDGGLASTHPRANVRGHIIREVLLNKLPNSADLITVLDRLDDFFDRMDASVISYIKILASAGMAPLKREKLRFFEERPAILG